MPDQIKRFPAPPVFEGDEGKTRTTKLLNILLIGFITSAVPTSFSQRQQYETK